jgi:AraC family transcriptional regulator of adaptative response / DNA-3-methyladenine glycosylase II
VFQDAHETALHVEVRFPDPCALLSIVERVRRMFDVAADPAVIAAHLQRDPLLRGPIARHPGIRVPGAWDGFELAVRAILGQQISVRAATTIAGRLAALFGSPIEEVDGLSRLFPTPAQLCRAPVERAGVMPARAETIRRLASAVASCHAPVGGATEADGIIAFDGRADVRSTITSMKRVPGIGDWTTQYVAMRALGEPDAWPSGDLILRRMAGGLTPRALERRADAWRPWRSYAVMLLWRGSLDGVGGREGGRGYPQWSDSLRGADGAAT